MRIPYAPEVATEAEVPEAEDGGLPLTTAEDTKATALGPTPVRVEPPSVVAPGAAVPHIGRDYSYVKAEVLRILAVAGFLLVSLVITAILRH